MNQPLCAGEKGSAFVMLAGLHPKKMNMNHLFVCTYDKFKWRRVMLNTEDFEDEFHSRFTGRAA